MIIPVMRLLVILLVALGAAAQPRPIGEGEREAAGVVALYLADGAEAVYARLTEDAPLRAISRDDAIREIAVRMGPREGVAWTLRTAERDAAFHIAWPSGYEDGVLVRMRGDRVHEILTLAEQSRDSKAVPVGPHSIWIPAAIGLAILGAIVATRWRLVGVALLALASAAAIIAYRERAPTHSTLAFVELRALTPLREALAEGREAKIPAGVTKEARDVATLWMLQSGLAVEIGGTKDDPLAELASVAKTPLAELLRARIALGDSKEDVAARAFVRASTLPPVRDDILYEAAFSFDNDHAEGFLARLRTLGSRESETYYRAAKETKSYDALRTAWLLEPMPREELLRANLVDDLRAKSLVSYFSATEPVRRSANFATRPLAWPAGAKAVVTGELLQVQIGRATIEVPNGAALAPKNAQVVAATYGARQRDAADLHEAQELLERGSPASRSRTIRAVRVLSRHNRWADVLKLTNDLPNNAPEQLIALRVRAFLRTGRIDDARALADRHGIHRLDEAFKQIEQRRALTANFQTIATAHFDIRHDATVNPAIALRIGDFLEAERTRVEQKLPRVEPRRVTVNVLSWDDFRGETKSDHILGLYDGEILFPLAAVEQFKPHIVSVITHELTHALLAQATNDNAPRWFQEGVAARMELVDSQENVFGTTPANLVLPVPLLDATMEKNSDPSAYVVASTFIRFLEDAYGAGAIATLASEFARGTSSDDAVTKLTGKTLDALNADFRNWGFHHTSAFGMDQPWPYDNLYSPGVDPRIRAGFKFGKRP